MNNEEKKIVPQLRFPEFEKDGNWDKKKLEKLSNKISDGIHSTPKYDANGEYFFVNGNNLIDGKIAITESTKRVSKEEFEKHKRELGKNSILLSINGTIGNISEYNNEKIVLGKSACYININEDKADKLFIIYSLKTEGIRRFFDTELTGSTIKNLSLKTVKNTIINLPKPKEQEIIANCLSSLDDVINAETEKLDLLEDHKKGLLQQLFPAEGETQPKFRFPEFKDDGDWEETTLDDVADYENGKAHEKEISETGKYKVVNSKFISTNGVVVKFTNSANLKTNVGDILMVLSDIPNGKAIAKCFYVDKEDTYTVNQRICKITPTDINNKFLFYVQNRNKYFLAFDDGVKQTNLRKDTVLSFPFLKPKDPKEQEKIANCLTLADDLIKKQVDKIVFLQDHKKGLLQQLFPNVND